MDAAHESALLILFEDPGVRSAAYLRALETQEGLETVVRCLQLDPDRSVGTGVLGAIVNELMLPERRNEIVNAMPAEFVDQYLRERVRWLNFCDEPGASAELSDLSSVDLAASPDWVQRRMVRLSTTPKWLLDHLSERARTKAVRNSARQRVANWEP